MDIEPLIRIFLAVAPVLIILAVCAWLLFWLERKATGYPPCHQTPSCECEGGNCAICGEGE